MAHKKPKKLILFKWPSKLTKKTFRRCFRSSLFFYLSMLSHLIVLERTNKIQSRATKKKFIYLCQISIKVGLKMRSLTTMNLCIAALYIKKTQAIDVNEIDIYLWTSQESSAAYGNFYCAVKWEETLPMQILFNPIRIINKYNFLINSRYILWSFFMIDRNFILKFTIFLLVLF